MVRLSTRATRESAALMKHGSELELAGGPHPKSLLTRKLNGCTSCLVHTSARPKSAFRFLLDLHSGVPVYRQIVDQVRGAVATGSLSPGDQLPTVRQLAVDLEINPNTVVRAYRELEYDGLLETHQGTGTFISDQKPQRPAQQRQRQLEQIASDAIARAGAAGFTIRELIDQLRLAAEGDKP
jgi:GntR family transcriptional regulator